MSKRTKIRLEQNNNRGRGKASRRQEAVKVYDAKAAIPLNARVAVDTIEAPLAVPEAPELQPAMRRDGSITPRGEELRPAKVPHEQVIRSIRDDPLANMHVRNSIDDTQFKAGRALQECFTQAEIGNVKAIVYKERVDTSGVSEPLTEMHRKSLRAINYAKQELGRELGIQAWALVTDIIRDGLHLKIAAQKRGLTRQREVEYLGYRFRECLNELAVVFGLSNRAAVKNNRAHG